MQDQVKKYLYIISITLVVVLIVVLVVGIVELIVLVSLYKTHDVIKSDNYTEGDTDVEQFNPHYCKAVEMTKSEGSTASLHLYNAKPPLSWNDTLKASFNGMLDHQDDFSDWSFHIHPGSNLTLSICVHTNPDCPPAPRDKVWFRIIRGEKNFSQWRGNMGNSRYAVNSTKLDPFYSYCPSPVIGKYSYAEEGDYWHVIETSLGICEVRVIANITIDRTQYYNAGTGVGTCTVPNKHSLYKCSVPVKTTHSPYYAFFAIDQKSTVTEWKNDIHVTLTCAPADWFWGVGIALGLGPCVVCICIGIGIGYCTKIHHCGYENLDSINASQELDPYGSTENHSHYPSIHEAPDRQGGDSCRVMNGQQNSLGSIPSTCEAPDPQSGDPRRVMDGQQNPLGSIA